MEVFFGDDVPKLDAHVGSDVDEVLIRPVEVLVPIDCGVQDAPVVIGVSVRIKSDLLFYKECEIGLGQKRR